MLVFDSLVVFVDNWRILNVTYFFIGRLQVGRPNQGQNLLHGFQSQNVPNIIKMYQIWSNNYPKMLNCSNKIRECEKRGFCEITF